MTKLKTSTMAVAKTRSKITTKRGSCCDQVFPLSAVIIGAATTIVAILCVLQPTAAAAAKLDTQIKLLINDDELFLQPQHQQQQAQQHQRQHQQQLHQHGDGDGEGDEAHYNLYRSELKRLSYETIHRILRDENEPVYRREDAELRYYQKRSYQPRHELVRRSTVEQQRAPALNLSRHALHAFDAAQQFENVAGFDYADIKTIDLSDNQLVEIKNLARFSRLHTLDLHGNALEALPLDGVCGISESEPGTTPPLTKLNLNGNRIKNATAPPCPRLSELHLSGNKIESLNALNLSALSALETLDLSCNKLRNLETAFFPQRMHNLKHLNLAGNQLGSIYRETFYNLYSLNTLLLRGNNISDIDYETFLALPNLQYLDLSSNQLHGSAIRALQGIPDLMGLSIAYNPQVGAAMQEFVASWSLKELDASGTGLCQIPAALAQSVRTLKLTDNWLKSINCGDLDSYPLLQYLDLSHSRIEDIEDDALGRLEILETLFLDHNRLHRVPLSLPTSLVQLFLQDNQIMDIQVQAFQALNNLQTLDLSGNKLLYLPALPLPKLLTLNVQAAELKGVSQAIVHTLPRLRDLLLEDNPIKCSDLMGLAEWATACRIVDEPIEMPNEALATQPLTLTNALLGDADAAHDDDDAMADVGQQTVGAKIDLKRQYVQMHNFYEKFQSNCGATMSQNMKTTTTTTPPPACAAKSVAAAALADALPTRSSRGATFVANENTEMPNEMLTAIISSTRNPTDRQQEQEEQPAAEVAATRSESMSKVTSNKTAAAAKISTESVVSQNESAAKQGNNMPNTSSNDSGSQSRKTSEANMRMNSNGNSSNTNSLQATKTLRRTTATPATETTTTTTTTTGVTTLLAKHANQKRQQQQQQQQYHAVQQIARMPTEANEKHANHVAIANETISLQTPTKRQTTTTATTAPAAPAINSGKQSQPTTDAAVAGDANVAAGVGDFTTPMGRAESALNNDAAGYALPVSTRTDALAAVTQQLQAQTTTTTTTTTTPITTAVHTKVVAATATTTTTVAATKVPQTILTTIKSGRQQLQQQQQQQHANDGTRSLLNKNNNEANDKITSQMADMAFLDSNDNNNNNNKHSLSDTSGQPTTTITATARETKIAPAPTTNAKMSTHAQQQQQHRTLPSQPTLPPPPLPHKHEPLQLHIKDRHLIGTPLLMHKGENILVDAEQLLLPGTATVGGGGSYHDRIAAAAAVVDDDASPSLSPTPSFQATTTSAPTTTTTTATPAPTALTPTSTSMSTTMTTGYKKQTSGKENAAGADSLAHGQFDKQTAIRMKQPSGQTEAINVQTNTHYGDTKLAADKSDNEQQRHQQQLKQQSKHKTEKEKLKGGNGGKKMKPSLSITKMTYSTKHATTTTTTTTTAATSTLSTTNSAEHEPLLLHITQQQQHNSVNTPNTQELSTFAQLKAAQIDHEQATLLLRRAAQQASDLSKTEQWLDTRPAATSSHSHPGVVLLVSVGLVILLLVGLMHVYRCDIPWRRHTHGVRPHRRQFNDDDAHSFLHYQGGSGSGGNSSSSNLPIQKWHHSTRREAPYSSPLHNLHVRELQKANAAQAQDKAQRCQQFYSATISHGATSGTGSSSCSNASNSSSSSSASSACGLNRSPTSSLMADESFYIEMTPDVGAAAAAQQHASDLLPMELLAASGNDGNSGLRHCQDEQIFRTTTTTTTTTISNSEQRDVKFQARKPMSNKLAPSARRFGIW